jgi:hypothetical protein
VGTTASKRKVSMGPRDDKVTLTKSFLSLSSRGYDLCRFVTGCSWEEVRVGTNGEVSALTSSSSLYSKVKSTS